MKTKARQIFEELSYPKLVVIGGGFAGLNLITRLANKPFKVTLLDANNFHTFQPLLYQVATGSLTPDSIAYPFRRSVAPWPNVVFRMARVEHIDRPRKVVITNIGEFPYDFLVVATGSATNFFGKTDLEDHAMQLKTVSQALDIRSDFLQEFERAISIADHGHEESLRQALNFVVVGGGPTGVEVSGALAEIKRNILTREYREVNPDLMQITLIESNPRLLGAMSASSGEKAAKYLRSMGVQVLLDRKVKSYDGRVVELEDGAQIVTSTVIWSAGVKGNSIPGLAQEAYHPSGRLKVDEYNMLLGHDYVFALGDVALMETKDYPRGHPMVAQVAIQQAKNLANNLLKLSKKQAIKPFQYRDKGSMATIGRNKAVVDYGKLHLGGFAAWVLWMGVHLLFLIGFRNRLAVLFNWVVKYFSFRNTIRIIVRPYVRREELPERLAR